MKNQGRVRADATKSAAPNQAKPRRQARHGRAGNRRPQGLTVIVKSPGGRTWCRVYFEPEIRVLIESAAASSGRSIEQLIRDAITAKIRRES